MDDIQHLSYHERQAWKEKRAEQYVREHPSLTPKQRKGRLSDTGLASKNIKQLLREAFPSIKFSVTSSSYSGGSSIRIHWVLWDESCPKSGQVKDLVDRFQTIESYGMDDGAIYDHCPENEAFRLAFGSSSHVFCEARVPTPQEIAARSREYLDGIAAFPTTRPRRRM